MPNLTHFDTVDALGNTTRYMFQDDVTYNAIQGLIDRASTDAESIGTWTNGDIDPATGNEVTSNTAALTPIITDSKTLLITVPSGYKIAIYCYNGASYIGCFTGLDFDTETTYFETKCYLYHIPYIYSIRVAAVKSNGDTISESDRTYLYNNVTGHSIPTQTP